MPSNCVNCSYYISKTLMYFIRLCFVLGVFFNFWYRIPYQNIVYPFLFFFLWKEGHLNLSRLKFKVGSSSVFHKYENKRSRTYKHILSKKCSRIFNRFRDICSTVFRDHVQKLPGKILIRTLFSATFVLLCLFKIVLLFLIDKEHRFGLLTLWNL